MNRFFGAANLTMYLVLAITVNGALPKSAHAQEEWRHHGRQKHERHGRWQEHERHDAYRSQHDVYYGAPPVVVAPRGYYPQPGASLNFSLPLFR